MLSMAGGARERLSGSLPLLGLACTGIALAWVIARWPPILSVSLLGAGAAGLIWLLFPALPVYALVLLTPFALPMEISGIEFSAHDFLLAALGLTLVLSLPGQAARLERFRSPLGRALLALWVFLLIWEGMAYRLGPANQALFSDFIHDGWYVYKTVWKAMAAFPLVVFCLDDRRAARRLLTLLLVTSVAVAMHGIWQAAQTGREATGVFDKKNQLAGFLVVVIPFIMARVVFEKSNLLRLVWSACLLVELRALQLTASRGGLVALMGAIVPLAALLPRRRVVAAGAAALALLILVVASQQDLLQRPSVQRALTLGSPAEVENMKWREEQWGFFLKNVADRPLLGTGSYVDESLADLDRARTAHNVFLGVAFGSGLPAAAGWLSLILLLLVSAARQAWRSVSSEGRCFWIGMTGCISALLTHSLVETNLLMFRMELLFWILAAITLVEWAGRDAPGSGAEAGLHA